MKIVPVVVCFLFMGLFTITACFVGVPQSMDRMATAMPTIWAKAREGATAEALGTPASFKELFNWQIITSLEIVSDVKIDQVQLDAVEQFITDNPIFPDNMEVGFTPKYIPIRIAVDQNRNLKIGASSVWVTDIGAFDLSASKTVISQQKGQLLIIQIDDRVAVYKLNPPGGEKFVLNFSDKYQMYRILSFRQETNGNIVLQLQTIK